MAKSANALCKNVHKDIKSQALTLANAVLAMQTKIEEQIPVYKELELSQELTTMQGELAKKANPAMQEFRATVRDYASALKDLNLLIEEHPAERSEKKSALKTLRSQVKVEE